MTRLYVNEIFASIQGEGSYTGTPAIFVRLQGCLCRCPWCDTKHTWKMGYDNSTPLQFAAEKQDAPRWATCTDDELAHFICTNFPKIKHVVFTGGEPLLQPIGNLCRLLLQSGRTVQVETSGTCVVGLPSEVWVTCSPKFNMPGGLKVEAQALQRANEIKMAVGEASDIETMESELRKIAEPKLVYLQPISMGEKATELCVRTALERGYRVSIQVHKYMNVR